jgi:hypothetical protein
MTFIVRSLLRQEYTFLAFLSLSLSLSETLL